MRHEDGPVGRMLMLLGIYFGVQIVLSTVLTFAVIVPQALRTMLGGGADNVGAFTSSMFASLANLLPLVLIASIVVTLPLYYLVYRRRKQDLHNFFQVRLVNPLILLLILIFGVSINVLIDYLLSVIQNAPVFSRFFDQYSGISDMLLGGDFLSSLLVTGIAVPIFEELLFRGFIFGELRRLMPIPVAILLQGLLFGIYHFNLIQSTYAMLIGFMLGFVYYRTGSILAPILLHASFNSSSLIIAKCLPDTFMNSGYTLIGCAVLAVAAAVLLFFMKGFQPLKPALAEPAPQITPPGTAEPPQ